MDNILIADECAWKKGENEKFWFFETYIGCDFWESLRKGNHIRLEWIGQKGERAYSLGKIIRLYQFDDPGLSVRASMSWRPRFIVIVGMYKCPVCKENSIRWEDGACYMCDTKLDLRSTWKKMIDKIKSLVTKNNIEKSKSWLN